MTAGILITIGLGVRGGAVALVLSYWDPPSPHPARSLLVLMVVSVSFGNVPAAAVGMGRWEGGTMTDTDLLVFGNLAMVPMLTGILDVLRRAFPDVAWDRWGPLASLLLGVALAVVSAVLTADADTPIVSAAGLGIMAGLSASGLLESVVSVRKVITNGGNEDG